MFWLFFFLGLLLAVAPATVVGTVVARLPATICHELAHWVVALLLRCRPSLPSILPKKDGDSWQLGAVSFYPGIWSGGLVALAPLWFLGSGLAAVASLLEEADWTVRLPGALLLGVLAPGVIPSSQDFLIALKYPVGTGLFCIGCVALLYTDLII